MAELAPFAPKRAAAQTRNGNGKYRNAGKKPRGSCQALGLNEQLRGPDHTLVGNDHANLGRLYYAMGNLPAACGEFNKALAIYTGNVKRKRLPKKHPYIAEVLGWLKKADCGKSR